MNVAKKELRSECVPPALIASIAGHVPFCMDCKILQCTYVWHTRLVHNHFFLLVEDVDQRYWSPMHKVVQYCSKYRSDADLTTCSNSRNFQTLLGSNYCILETRELLPEGTSVVLVGADSANSIAFRT